MLFRSERIIVDSTVQEKAIAYPVDSRLLEIARHKIVVYAKRCGIALRQDGTDAVNVSCHHRQRHIALEARDAMVGASIESMHFQPIDRRLHRRVRSSGRDKLL